MKKEKLKSRKGTHDPARQISKPETPFQGISFGHLTALAIIVVLGALIYSNSFDCSFHLDDTGSIVNNTAIRNLSDITAIWNFSHTRFVAYYTLALNYHHGELNVWGYHLVNLRIHLINACLVYWFTLLMFSTPALKENALARDKKLIALIAALMFVSHPLATQSVTYIVQRMASLVTLFYLLSLSFYAKARLTDHRTISQYLLFAGCLVSALLALFTKENAVTLPLAIILFEICFLQAKDRPLSFSNYRIGLLAAVFLGAITLALFSYSGSILQPILPESANDYRTITPLHYLFTQFSVILKYIALFFLPVNQNLDYDIPLSNSFFEIRTLLSFILLLSVFVLGIFLFKKYRVLSFGIFWFFLTLSVESSIIPISDLIFEHRTYLPSVGFSIAFSAGLYLLLWEKYRFIAVFTFLAIIVSNAYLSFQRNKVWKDDLTLWSDVVLKSPNKSRGYHNRGIALEESGKLEDALKDYNKAIELKPVHYNAYNSRGGLFVKTNKLNQAVEDYSKTIELNPGFDVAYLNRASTLTKLSKYEEAIPDCNKFIELKPEVPSGYYSRGLSYMSLGKKEPALADYNKAIELEPEYLEAYVNRGVLLRDMNRTDEALRDFEKALTLNPSFPIAYFSRGTIWLNQKKYAEAIADFSTAISFNINYAKAYFNRGIAHYQMNNKAEGCKDLQRAFELGFQPAKDILNQYCK